MAHFKILSMANDYELRTKVLIQIVSDTGEKQNASPLVFVPRVAHEIPEPTIGDDNLPGDLDGRDFLQAVLDHAWEKGMRPVGFNDAKNETTALKAHLHDMRSLVFKDTVRPKDG